MVSANMAMKWKDDLEAFFKFHQYEPIGSLTACTLAHTQSTMKMFYPGNYRLDWNTDISKSAPFNIIFDDEQEQIVWLLKYS